MRETSNPAVETATCPATCGTYHCQRSPGHTGSTDHESVAGMGDKPGTVKVLQWTTGYDEKWVARKVVR